MTLILAMANPSYVLQVGDRLVSQKWRYASGAIRNQPWEELANKALVYVASDAIVAISYTGVAYINDKNTDTWLAEQLDSEISRGPLSALRSGGTERRVGIGAAINQLVVSIDDAFTTTPIEDRSAGLTLQIVGWKWRGRNPYEMPIVWHLINSGDDGASTLVERLPRYWGWQNGQCRLDAIGNRDSKPLADLTSRMSGNDKLHADFVQGEMVETIRAASALSDGTIGPNCISLLMSLSTGNVRVCYIPESSAAADYEVFTPWLIAPGAGVSAPSRLTAGLPVMHLGGLEVSFERIHPPDSFGSGGMSHLPRK